MDSQLPYFPRAPFDQVCLGHLANLAGIAIFAPRRRGKTAFVVHELIPGAQNRGYSTVYVDLWRNQSTPELSIVHALERALPAAKWKVSKIKSTGKAKWPAGEVGGEVELTTAAEPAPSIIERLNQAMDRLRDTGKPWLIVMDEFQALAAAKEEGFVAALRAGVQGATNIKLFVTGSSRRQLSKMLTAQKSPFLGMLMQVDLPELDEKFIRQRCDLIHERSRRKVPLKALMATFERVVRVPEYLNQIVSTIIVEGIYNPEVAYETWRSRRTEGEAATAWETLSELDRLVLAIIGLRPGTPIFGEQTVAWLSAQLEERTTTGKIQGALRRLERGGLIDQGMSNGSYEIGDDNMRLFLEGSPVKMLPPDAT